MNHPYIDRIKGINAIPGQLFRIAVYANEQEKRMPYVTSIERLAKAEGREEGLREGLQESIVWALDTRFGNAGRRLASKVKRIKDKGVLGVVLKAVWTCQSLAEVRKCLGEVESTL
jgi:hypothetical protein